MTSITPKQKQLLRTVFSQYVSLLLSHRSMACRFSVAPSICCIQHMVLRLTRKHLPSWSPACFPPVLSSDQDELLLIPRRVPVLLSSSFSAYILSTGKSQHPSLTLLNLHLSKSSIQRNNLVWSLG